MIPEIETINKAIHNALERGAVESLVEFHVGEFIQKPNQLGCFKRNEKWYMYESDEKNFCTFSGPFNLKGIIYACGMRLHISKHLKEYRFSESELESYLNNNFHTLLEIDNFNK